MAIHSLESTQADPLYLSENLISWHARSSDRAVTPFRPGVEPRPARAVSPSAQQALWPINSGLAY